MSVPPFRFLYMATKHSNTTSNYLPWDTMLSLVRKLYRDGNYRMSLLVGCGSFFGLRISDLRQLTWSDLLDADTINLNETKTGKSRTIKINTGFRKHIQDCYCKLGNLAYMRGETDKAADYYRRAAKLNNARALLNIAIGYLNKEIRCFRFDEVKCFLAKSSALGNRRAFDLLKEIEQ